jgi:hypothetical protein
MNLQQSKLLLELWRWNLCHLLGPERGEEVLRELPVLTAIALGKFLPSVENT